MKIMKKSLIGLLSVSMLVGSVTPYIANGQEVVKPTLTVTPKATENYIQLDWGMANKSQPYSYQIKQIKEGSTEPQSIQAKKTVKVLNIYPDVSTQITYSTWDGTTRTIAKSASAEMWMETPNAEHSKGYGMGLIDIEPISLDLFNAEPEKYLKDENGQWKYDAIFLGAWDANNYVNLNENASGVVRKFIEDGRGFLAGHDTIGYLESSQYFNENADLFNIEPTGGTTIGHTEVKISKKGLLTNYPWEIGDIGTTLNVPASHTLNHKALGDVWMMYTDNTRTTSKTYLDDPTYNFYLTSWNNTAMIQTGHSNGSATPDEQKVIANTLFYLSQITTETSWTDRSGQDLEAPDAPTIQNASYNKVTGNLQLSYQSVVDNGSDYTYQVEATGQNDGVKSSSDPVTATITSGLQGYSITVDTNPNTTPDKTIETTNSSYSLQQNFTQNFYIHVGAVDKQGNMSVAHYEVDITAPEKPLLTATPSSPTNGNVSVVASFPSSATSQKYSIGDWVKGKTDTSKRGIYVQGTGLNRVDSRKLEVNGEYVYFEATGRGHRLTVLDKKTLSVLEDLTYDTYGDNNAKEALATKLNSLDSNVIVVLSSFDAINMSANLQNALAYVGGSGDYIEYRTPHVIIGSPGLGKGNGIEVYTSTDANAPYAEATAYVLEDGTITGAFYNYTAPIEVKENGVKVSAKGIDTAGNHSALSSYTVNNIDRNAPNVQNIRQDITTPTNQPVTLTVTGSDAEFGVEKMYAPDLTKRGLTGHYYTNTITKTNQFALERLDSNIDFAWNSNSPDSKVSADRFFVEWNGLVYAPTTGKYDFYLTSDDGSKLLVNNKTIIDRLTIYSGEAGGSVELEGGKWYPISIQYLENYGSAGIKLLWKNPSMSSFEVIPSDSFAPYGTAVNGNSINKTVSDNGSNLFVIEDYAGNRTVTQATVSNIDKEAPSKPSLQADVKSATNQSVTVSATFSTDTVKKEVKINGNGEWSTYTTPIVMANNGYVEVRGYDVAGNVSEVARYDVTNIDKVAPGTPSITPSTTTVTKEDVTLTIHYSSDSVVKEYRIGSGSWTSYSSPVVLSNNTKIEARGKDSAGNYSTISSYDVTNIDKVAPNAPQFSANKTTPTNTEVTVTATFPSDAFVKQVRVNGGAWTTYSTPITITNNGTVEGRSIDQAGNISSVASYQVSNIDKVAPTTPSLVADKTNPTNTDVVVTASFATDVVKKEARINNGSWTPYTTPITMTANGKVEVKGTDEAGNVSAVASYDVTNIDKDAPAVPTFSPNTTSPTNQNVTVAINYPSDSDVKEYRIGTGTWTSYLNPVVVSTNVKVEARAKDLAGNYSAIGSYSVTNIDKVSPNAPTLSADKTSPTNTNVSVSVQYSSDAILKQVRVNDGVWQNYSSPMILTENGKVEARAFDEAGNVSAVASYQVTNIDKIAPTTPSLVADKTNPTNTDVVVTATFPVDAHKKEVRVNDGTWTLYATPITMTANGKVEVRATDEAGNVSAIASYDVSNIDKAKPNQPTVSANTTAPTNANVLVTVEYPTDASLKEIRVNGGNWTVYSTPVSVSENGKVEARAKDVAGNYSDVATFNVTNIDKVKPVMPTLSANTTVPTNEFVIVSATFPSDVVKKEVKVNNGSWTVYTDAITFENNGYVEVRGYDQAGNVSDVAHYEVKNIDKIAPEKPTYSVKANQNSFTMNGDNNSTLYYRSNNGEWVKYTEQVTLTDGSFTIEFKSVDQAGNTSEVVTTTTIMYHDALALAVTEVEKAEKEPVQENIDIAKVKVNAIPHNAPEYEPLMARLNDLQALVDAQKAIEKAIETRSEEDVAKAKEKIDLLNNNNPIIIDLLDEVETDFEEADILALVAKERYDLLSAKYEVSKPSYTALVQIYYAIKYTGDNMYKMAQDKVALVPADDIHYEFVQDQLKKLQEDYNQFVEERVATDAEIKAEASVQVMESKYDPTLALNTQNLINAVEDATKRAELQSRLDSAKSKYEASLLDKATQSAITAVEKAESMKQSYYVTEAYKKVNVLTNETLKAELTARLQTVEAQIAYDRQVTDATRLVQFAEQYKSQYYIDSAQKKIDALPDGEDKTSLQQRLDAVKSGMTTSDQATVIKNATNYVSLAQTMKTQYYVDKAQGYVDQILDEVKKAELQAKLDAIVVK